MSRKHYVAIATILQNEAAVSDGGRIPGADIGRLNAVEGIATGLARFFAKENPNFDLDRFLRACGINPEN